MSFRGDGGSESGGDRAATFDPLVPAQAKMVNEYLDFLAAQSNAGAWQYQTQTADLWGSDSLWQIGDAHQSQQQRGVRVDNFDQEETEKQRHHNENTSLAFFDPVTKELDAKKPTLLVFDNFGGRRQSSGLPPAAGEAVSVRGDVSAEEAEKQGFNVVRVGSTQDTPALDRTLPELADKIETGDLALGKGDIVNINAESNISYKSAGDLLGLSITADNVKDMVPDMLHRMRELSEDPRQDAATRTWLKQMLAVNDAAKRIAGKGIEVVASAGSDGPDKFNIAALTATTQLDSRTETGELSALSADNSLVSAEQESQGQRRQESRQENIPTRSESVSDPLARPYMQEQYVMGWTRGTSFANVDYFGKNFERLRLLKNSA